MKPIKKIMVAVDESKYSKPSLQFARYLAVPIDASLIVATIVNELEFKYIQQAPIAVNLTNISPNLAQLVNRRTDWLNALIKEAGVEALVAEKIVAVGTPYFELLEIIKKNHPDLLVMGTKGRSNFADAILGSCAQRMFRRCPIPLLSLRPQK